MKCLKVLFRQDLYLRRSHCHAIYMYTNRLSYACQIPHLGKKYVTFVFFFQRSPRFSLMLNRAIDFKEGWLQSAQLPGSWHCKVDPLDKNTKSDFVTRNEVCTCFLFDPKTSSTLTPKPKEVRPQRLFITVR